MSVKRAGGFMAIVVTEGRGSLVALSWLGFGEGSVMFPARR